MQCTNRSSQAYCQSLTFSERCFLCGYKRILNLPSRILILRNDKIEFKSAMNRYLTAHAFYSLEEFSSLDEYIPFELFNN